MGMSDCMTVADALSRGLSAGSYANAYVSEDLETAWEAEQADETDGEDDEALAYLAAWRRDHRDVADAFRAAFVIGFFGSHTPAEIDSDHKEEHDQAMHEHGAAMKAQGLAVDTDYCAVCDGYVAPDHDETEDHKRADARGE
jgi:hypothetical protein